MALEYKDRVSDSTATTGTGTLLLMGVSPNGYRSFAVAGYSNGATIRYSITSSDETQWEVGQGTYNSTAGTLSRDLVYASSNGDALVPFAAGTKTVQAAITAADTHRVDVMQVTLTTPTNTPSTEGFAKVPFNNVVLNVGGMWDPVNLRAKPTRAGVYSVSAYARTVTNGGLNVMVVSKNGVTVSFLGYDLYGNLVGSGNALVSMNGTTDYLEIFVYVLASRAYVTDGTTVFNVVGPL